MLINQPDETTIYDCDGPGCGKRTEPINKFRALELAFKNGWHVNRRINGNWHDFCSEQCLENFKQNQQ